MLHFFFNDIFHQLISNQYASQYNIKMTHAIISDDSFVNEVSHLWGMPPNVHGIQALKKKIIKTWIQFFLISSTNVTQK